MIVYAIFAAIMILIVAIVLVASGITAIVSLVRRRRLASAQVESSKKS